MWACCPIFMILIICVVIKCVMAQLVKFCPITLVFNFLCVLNILKLLKLRNFVTIMFLSKYSAKEIKRSSFDGRRKRKVGCINKSRYKLLLFIKAINIHFLHYVSVCVTFLFQTVID